MINEKVLMYRVLPKQNVHVEGMAQVHYITMMYGKLNVHKSTLHAHQIQTPTEGIHVHVYMV